MASKIYQAIAQTMQDVGAVGKDATNNYDKYKYRSIDAVMNAMHPAMTKNRLFVIPEVLEIKRETHESKDSKVMNYTVATVKYTFTTDDGSSIDAVVVGEGSDRGDKSVNKAMSAAYKYALFQVFCIPTEEMIDSERDSDESAPRKVEQDAPPKKDEQQPREIPYMEYAIAHPKETINNMQVDEISRRADAEAVPVTVILSLYKVQTLSELSNYKYCDLMGVHWEAVKAAGAKYKEGPPASKKVSINDL